MAGCAFLSSHLPFGKNTSYEFQLLFPPKGCASPPASSVKALRFAPMNANCAALTARTARRREPARKSICFLCSKVPLRKKQKPKRQRSERCKQKELSLYYQQGSSDKVYHLQLENVEDQWSVNAQWGRRGSALQSDTKVSSVTYEEAKRVYDRILREKTGKGYQIAQANDQRRYAAISVGLPARKSIPVMHRNC